jgi:queuosine precursor transporter
MNKQGFVINKETGLYILLAAVFLTSAMVAELIGVKMFSLEKAFGIPPVDLPFIGEARLSLNMSVGILIWPVVFIISDIINEYFGKPGVRRISFLAAGMIGYGFVIILSGTHLPPADFWLDINQTDAEGRPFNIDYAYNTIFRQGLGIIIGSITAFLVGQLVDMHTFHFLRKLTRHRMLWLRATGSTIVSQLVDSFLILFIAFYLLGNWNMIQVLSIGLIQYLYKVTMAILLTPLIYWMHHLIDRYLGREKSDELITLAGEGKVS